MKRSQKINKCAEKFIPRAEKKVGIKLNEEKSEQGEPLAWLVCFSSCSPECQFYYALAESRHSASIGGSSSPVVR